MDASTGDPPATALRSLAVVAGTTLCAFATLATSQTPVLHAIGLTVTIGATLCAALSLLLLPFQKTPVAA
jgi:predicted exporter